MPRTNRIDGISAAEFLSYTLVLTNLASTAGEALSG